MRTYYVYIMASRSRVLYVGVTNNLMRRAQEHKEGANPGFTSRYRVTRLVYFEEFRYIEQVETGDVAVLQFETRVGDRQLQGVDILKFAENGAISELTVMVRPLSGIHALAEAMQKLLESPTALG